MHGSLARAMSTRHNAACVSSAKLNHPRALTHPWRTVRRLTNPLLPLASPAPVNCGDFQLGVLMLLQNACDAHSPSLSRCGTEECFMAPRSPHSAVVDLRQHPNQRVNERLLPNTFSSASALMHCSPSWPTHKLTSWFTGTSTPAAICLRTDIQTSNGCISRTVDALPRILSPRVSSASRMRRTLLCPQPLLARSKGASNMTPNALTQKIKTPCCLNHQKEMNRLVQTGATRVHHNAKHTTAHHEPRQPCPPPQTSTNTCHFAFLNHFNFENTQ